MLSMIFELILDMIKDATEEYVDSAKDYLYGFFKRAYVFMVLFVISTAMFSFSLMGFVSKIADRLDLKESFIWTPSMTLYSVICLGASGVLYYLLKNNQRRHPTTLEREIAKTIATHKKKRKGKR